MFLHFRALHYFLIPYFFKNLHISDVDLELSQITWTSPLTWFVTLNNSKSTCFFLPPNVLLLTLLNDGYSCYDEENKVTWQICDIFNCAAGGDSRLFDKRNAAPSHPWLKRQMTKMKLCNIYLYWGCTESQSCLTIKRCNTRFNRNVNELRDENYIKEKMYLK